MTPSPEIPAVVGDEGCDGTPGSDPVRDSYGDSGPQTASGVAVDPSTGDAPLVGTFESAIQIGNDMFISKGGADVFLARFNPLGQPLWAAQIGAQGDQKAQGIALGTDGSIVISGFSSSAWMLRCPTCCRRLVRAATHRSGRLRLGRGRGGDLKSELFVAVELDQPGRGCR